MKYVTSSQMSRADKLAVKGYGINILQMMENAGRNLADFVFGLKPKKVIVFFGKGNNGGGGLAAARHLLIKGIKTEIVSASKRINKIPMKQLFVLRKMGIREKQYIKLKKGDVIIDALLGHNIRGNPKGKFADIINSINFMKRQGIRVVSLDLPSGLDPDLGRLFKPCVEADYTLTLALPKRGLKLASKEVTGEIYLANIGIPNEVFRDLKLNVGDYFYKGDIIAVTK